MDALAGMVATITDFYRIKLAGGTQGARGTITTIERSIFAMRDGKVVRAKAAKVLLAGFDLPAEFSGDPASDWRVARKRLLGAVELDESSTRPDYCGCSRLPTRSPGP
jgi:DNA helicase-2/ATP-dependent DNA helicase PcrA